MTAELSLACVNLRHKLEVATVLSDLPAEHIYNYWLERFTNGLNYSPSAFATGCGAPIEDLPEPRYGLRREGSALHRQ